MKNVSTTQGVVSVSHSSNPCHYFFNKYLFYSHLNILKSELYTKCIFLKQHS